MYKYGRNRNNVTNVTTKNVLIIVNAKYPLIKRKRIPEGTAVCITAIFAAVMKHTRLQSVQQSTG
jgi:hypothetical protein